VGQPLPHSHRTSPTWCALRLVAPSRDWNVFKQSLAEPWDGFTPAQPRSQPASSHGLVAKRLDGGQPAKRGASEDRCRHGGQGKPLVALRCQASLCLRCAQVSVATWGSQVSKLLHAGVLDRPSIRTVPARCRPTCSQNAAVVVSAFMRGGAHGLDDCSSTVRGKALKGGASTVLHPHGRQGQYPPPASAGHARGG
jgi:hypothetical protein